MARISLVPQRKEFYELYRRATANVVAIAQALASYLDSFPEGGVESIKELEHTGDGLTREVIDLLNRTFVTPFDREDIHALASELDQVIDLIDGTARRATIFRIQRTRPAVVVLAEVLDRAARTVEDGVRNMKNAKHVYAVSEKLKLLEEEGDAVYHEAMGALFAEGGDALEVIKWKDLYDKVEDALDQCEDVGNVLQSIALKNA